MDTIRMEDIAKMGGITETMDTTITGDPTEVIIKRVRIKKVSLITGKEMMVRIHRSMTTGMVASTEAAEDEVREATEADPGMKIVKAKRMKMAREMSTDTTNETTVIVDIREVVEAEEALIQLGTEIILSQILMMTLKW